MSPSSSSLPLPSTQPPAPLRRMHTADALLLLRKAEASLSDRSLSQEARDLIQAKVSFDALWHRQPSLQTGRTRAQRKAAHEEALAQFYAGWRYQAQPGPDDLPVSSLSQSSGEPLVSPVTSQEVMTAASQPSQASETATQGVRRTASTDAPPAEPNKRPRLMNFPPLADEDYTPNPDPTSTRASEVSQKKDQQGPSL